MLQVEKLYDICSSSNTLTDLSISSTDVVLICCSSGWSEVSGCCLVGDLDAFALFMWYRIFLRRFFISLLFSFYIAGMYLMCNDLHCYCNLSSISSMQYVLFLHVFEMGNVALVTFGSDVALVTFGSDVALVTFGSDVALVTFGSDVALATFDSDVAKCITW